MAVQSQSELLDRANELATLGGHLRETASTGQGQLVLICGEAGIGKTALVRRFCSENSRIARVLVGACDPLFAPRPLGPLLDIAQEAGGKLGALLSDGGRPHEVCHALLEEAASGTPVILVLEDLHWADTATLDVVRLVARRVEGAGLVVLATFRDDELGRGHPLRLLLGEILRSPSVSRLQLKPLSPESVSYLARGRQLDVDELYRKTAGNPFFVTEVLASATSRIPAAVRDAVLARAARLSSPAQELLEVVAIAPPVMEPWLLESVASGGQGALDECLASGILAAHEGGIAFRHELARSAVIESVNPIRLRELHRRAVTSLKSPPDGRLDVTRLAHHAEAGGDAEAVLAFAPAAGAVAAARGAHREAAAQYARALRFASGLEPIQLGGLFELHAQETYLTDQFDGAIASGRAAVESYYRGGDRLREADAQRKLTHLLRCAGHHDEARLAAAESLSLLKDLPPCRELAQTYATQTFLYMCKGEHDQTIEWGRRTIELAETVDAPAALLHALNSVGSMEMESGIGAGAQKLFRSLDLALELGLEEDVGRAYLNYAAMAAATRSYAGLDAWIEAGLAYCSQRGLDLWAYYLVGARARVALDQGRWDLAVELAGRVLAQTESALPRQDPLLVIALVRARRGDPDWQSPLAEARSIGLAANELQTLAPVSLAEAEIAWLDGRRDQVVGLTNSSFELARRERALWWVGDLACWRRRVGLRETVHGVPAPHRQELAGNFSLAAREWMELGCPYDAAMVLAQGHDGDLAGAHRQLLNLGARAAAAVVARRMRERGMTKVARGPRPATLANPAKLTGREMEVLKLLAEDVSNAAIGHRLHLSTKTVDHHVSAILAKLEVDNRRLAIARAEGLRMIL